MPNQLVAVLADPLLQKFLLLRPNAEGASRISNWLMACLGDVASGDADSDLLLDMLEVVHDFALATKVCRLNQAVTLLQLTLATGIAAVIVDIFCSILHHLGRFE